MKINSNVALSESGFLFNPLTGDFFTLNPIGIEIFELIKKENNYKQIMENILLKYNVDEATFENDYFDFTGFLRQYNLVDTEN